MIWKRVILRKLLRKKLTEKEKNLSMFLDQRIDPVGIQMKRKREDFNIMDQRIDIARKRSRKDFDTMDQTVDAMDRISQLPEPIIHHILSFLHTEDAARTSILSKKWKQMWESFPILDFDQRYFQVQDGEQHGSSKEKIQEIQNNKKFRNFVDYCLQSRLEQKFSIQKFRLYIASFDSELAPHMNRWISFANENNVKELDLHVQVKKYRRYSLPQTVLTAKTITELSLYGCKLKTCNDVQLSYLQKLCLKKIYVGGQKIQNLIRSCPLIEDLRLISCNGLRKLEVSTLLRLNRVEVHLCHGLKAVNIEAPDLQTFWFYRKKSMRPCEINLATCKSLKRLALEDPNMTDELFQKQLFNFPILEQLVLSKCSSLENIQILSQHLKSLTLRGCKNLVEAEIDSPNLLTFEYDGDKLPFSSMIPSGLLEAKLSFESLQKAKLGFCYGDDDFLWFAKLRGFLAKLNHSGGLKLVVRSKKNVIIHEDLGEILLPPLYNLKLEIIKSSMSFKDLLEYLLRTHHPETLCIVSSSTSKFIELIHEKLMNREEDTNCCRYYSKKCWRHYLKDVEIENFEVTEDIKNPSWNAWLKSIPTHLCQTTSFRLKWNSH
ncbi:hypothetical protein L1049_005483 [Liquidambar formosana]|uniref:F-box domain-containing protein n=1 Tax=Liquidambar formosana TaxID=63359 RepID=A0AAP0WXN7_LIQFO